ncbi:MAG: hypothetical protein AAGF15_01220 [Pseudomonadota bacterium]
MGNVAKYLPIVATVLITVIFTIMGFLPKLTGAAEPQYLFGYTFGSSDFLGLNAVWALFEPLGRYAIGATELLVVVLLWLGVFISVGMRKIGALLGLALMAGAIFFHLTIIGVATDFPLAGQTPPFGPETLVESDGGTLFGAACLSFLLFIYLFVSKPKT